MKIGLVVFIIWFFPISAQGDVLNRSSYTKDYAFVTCLARVYETHLGEKNKIVHGLNKEAWFFFEKGNSTPDTYNDIYNSAALEAKKIPLNAVYRACREWLLSPEIKKLYSDR